MEPRGRLALDTFSPGIELLSLPDDTRVLELETRRPRTGRALRLFDTRRFERVEQIQRSLMEVEERDEEGRVVARHPSATSIRWIYKAEMGLLLQVARFARWEIWGDFDRRPLTRETDAMVVEAWSGR